MGRQRKEKVGAADLPRVLEGRLRPPFGVVLGSPREAADVVAALPAADVLCYQMDLYPAGRLRQELEERGLAARVEAAPDLWDLPADRQTLVYPAERGGERGLKLDMVEQAYHVLGPHGVLVVLSPYENDQFFPGALRKVFGRFHAPAAGGGRVFWAQREGERPRRRHEVTFQVRAGDGASLRFLSRPGVFAYGRFDEGARALTETMAVEPGDRVLDAGCGCGTNGVLAGRRGGPGGFTAFADSNLRALALAGHNARANDLTDFRVAAGTALECLPEGDFDVALANPPYFAQGQVARLFAERSRRLLRPGGRFYLVTRQPDVVGPLVAEVFGPAEAALRRGYVILCARAPGAGRPRRPP
jgi:16S rRNA (guanine1207-N2)-methyltransferase